MTAYRTVVLHQFTLEAPQSADGLLYALINQLTLFCNMQLNMLNDLAEAMKALDGKKRSVKEAVGSEKCEAWSVKCAVWSVKFKFGVRRAQCQV